MPWQSAQRRRSGQHRRNPVDCAKEEDAQPIFGLRLEYATRTLRSLATPGPLPAKKTFVGKVRWPVRARGMSKTATQRRVRVTMRRTVHVDLLETLRFTRH